MKSPQAQPRITERKAKLSRGGNSGAARILQRLQAFEELILHNELINYNPKRIADAALAREIPSGFPWILGSLLCLQTLPRDDCE